MTNLPITHNFIKYFNIASKSVYKYKSRGLSNWLKHHTEADHTAQHPGSQD